MPDMAVEWYSIFHEANPLFTGNRQQHQTNKKKNKNLKKTESIESFKKTINIPKKEKQK
jgi:hypothetical protein